MKKKLKTTKILVEYKRRKKQGRKIQRAHIKVYTEGSKKDEKMTRGVITPEWKPEDAAAKHLYFFIIN
jgi:hypothetical protein